MSTATELLRRALDRIDWVYPSDIALKDEIRTYLAAEPEAEPVAWIHCQGEDYEELHTWSLTPECVSVGWTQYPLYRHPPKPEPARKPMTDEEMEKQYEIDKEYFGESVMRAFYNGVRFAEKHHGIGRGME